MTVLTNGHHVVVSPFLVNVSNYATQPGKHVKIWTDLRRRFGISANSRRDFFTLYGCRWYLRDGTTTLSGKRVDVVENMKSHHSM